MSTVRTILHDDQWQKLAPMLPGKAGIKVGQDKITSYLLKPFYGSFAPARRGGIYRQNWAIGTPRTPGSNAGAKRVSGKESLMLSAMTAT